MIKAQTIIEYVEKDGRLVKISVLNIKGNHAWRCGYVGVPEGHSLYDTDYNKLDNIEVHGGLTFSNYNQRYDEAAGVQKYWYLGFDCAHSNDVLDTDTKVKYNVKDYNYHVDYPITCDLDYVKCEVKYLAKQIQELEEEKKSKSMIKTYVKKPVKIQAIQWTGDNILEIQAFQKTSDNPNAMYWTNDGILISTREGDMIASVGDYIIRGVKGEFYPCKPDIFKETYEEVTE